MDKEIQTALDKAFANLEQIGNGYGWTVATTAAPLLQIIAKYVPTFNPANVTIPE
jgi:hypothetical protein